MIAIYGHPRLPSSFWAQVKADLRTGCWVWTGPLFSGYGSFYRPRDTTWRTHRLVYVTFVGPISEGLEIDHLCRVKACCNPDHLEPVTRSENLLRARTARRLDAKLAALRSDTVRAA